MYPVSKNIWEKPKNDEFLKISDGRRRVKKLLKRKMLKILSYHWPYRELLENNGFWYRSMRFNMNTPSIDIFSCITFLLIMFFPLYHFVFINQDWESGCGVFFSKRSRPVSPSWFLKNKPILAFFHWVWDPKENKVNSRGSSLFFNWSNPDS